MLGVLPSVRAVAVAAARSLIMKHAHGWCIEIIELATSSAVYERDDRNEHDERGERHDDEDDAHESRSLGNDVLDQDANTTVNELNGIRIAAMSGVMVPVTASVAPMTL